MRVCLVSAAYRPYPSGVSEHVRHLAIELERLGHRAHILTTNYPGQAADDLCVTRLGQALVLPANRSHYTLPVGLNLAGEVRDFLRRERFDVVHCHGIFPPETAYWAARYAPAPVVVSFHTYRPYDLPLLRLGFHALFGGINRRVSARIAVSVAGRDWAARWLPGEYHVIPNGVDTSRFSPDTPPDPRLSTGPSVLYVGRLDRRKGLLTLIQAFARVITTIPGARLVVAGSGPLEGRARRLCADLGIVTAVEFLGRVPDEHLPGLYSGCSVFCSPALGGEAMGIVLIEAMASRRPVVCSNIPGYDEVVTDGRDGLLFPDGDAEALAVALLRVLQSEELAQGLAARALARSADFAWPRIARRVEQVYQEVLA